MDSWFTQKRVFLWPEPISVIKVHPIFLDSSKLICINLWQLCQIVRLFEVPGLLIVLPSRAQWAGPGTGNNNLRPCCRIIWRLVKVCQCVFRACIERGCLCLCIHLCLCLCQRGCRSQPKAGRNLSNLCHNWPDRPSLTPSEGRRAWKLDRRVRFCFSMNFCKTKRKEQKHYHEREGE